MAGARGVDGESGRGLTSNFFTWFTICSVLALVLVFSVGTIFDTSHRTHESDNPPEHVGTVSEIAWTWEPPRSTDRVGLRAMNEGVLVLLDEGVVALSGETGEELWSYRDRGQDHGFIADVTSNGEYVVIYDEETYESIILERDTGQIAQEYTLDLDEIDYTQEFSANPLEIALTGVSGDTWTVRWEDSVASYDLSSGDVVWAVSDVPNCSGGGQVDGLSVQDDVVIAATTCFDQPEDRDSVASTVGWDFTSELVGLDPENGEELWRVEHSVGRMPFDSMERSISYRSGGFVYIDFNYKSLGYSLLDVEAREATHLGSRELLWSSPDGESLGLWDPERREYQVQDRSGEVERTMRPDLEPMSGDILADGHQVGLEDGILHLEENVLDAPVDSGFARFDGFDGSSVLTWDGEDSMSINSARSVPGAVAVSYSVDGDRGVMGLQ